MSSLLTSIVHFGEEKVKLTWIPCTQAELGKYSPITQAYGVCFNESGEILIIYEDDEWGWKIPGGTPENGESLVSALKREILEEADVEIDNPILLGIQRVEKAEHTYYQSRFFCLVKKIHTQTVDPAKGIIHERKFVPVGEVTKYVAWGRIGEAIFQLATDLYQKSIGNGIK